MMARRRAGLTQRQLAERLDLRQATIARWERGDRSVDLRDLDRVAHACGLQLDVHLQIEDRSWWPQIAMQLELDPLARVRRLTAPGAPDVAAALSELAAADASAIVVGEVAGALHGWPLVLGSPLLELCGSIDAAAVVSGEVRVVVNETPPGTSGGADLARSAVTFTTPGGAIHAAGLIDLMRIADASPAAAARRDSLALQAVLDVQRRRAIAIVPNDRPAEERLADWLGQQPAVA